MVKTNRRRVRGEVYLYILLNIFILLQNPLVTYLKIWRFLRDFDDRLYLKEDAGKLLVGIFEGKSIPAFAKTHKVPNDFSFGEFPENFDHFEPYLEASC